MRVYVDPTDMRERYYDKDRVELCAFDQEPYVYDMMTNALILVCSMRGHSRRTVARSRKSKFHGHACLFHVALARLLRHGEVH